MRSEHARARWIGIGAVIAVGFGFGCDLFEPRDPNPPTDTNPIPPECRFNDPVNEIDVLTNLINAFGCGTNGIDLFEKSHEPDLLFVPLATDDPVVVETINGWTGRADIALAFSQQVDDERDFILSFDDIDDLTITTQGDRRIFEDAKYRLEIEDGDDVVADFGGIADIFVVQGSNGWAIIEWRDDERPGVGGTLGNFYVNGISATP